MQSQTPTRLRVLYVDDDLSVRRAVCRGLRTHFDVDDVADAASVENAVRSTRYDGFITDLEMPQVDGFQMIRRVASVDARLALRAVVLTGAHFTQDELADLADKGYCLVEKGSKTEDIVRAVLARIHQYP